MQTRRYIAGIALVLCLCGQAAGERPGWVRERPQKQGYFTGIGVASREGDAAEVRKQATNSALRDIATQIEVNVSSHTALEEEEDAFGLRQAYSSQIRTMVSKKLAGVEIVDTWEGEDEFWVYARLSEAKFAALRQEKIDNARRLVFSLFEQAEKKMPGAVAEGLALYLQALGAVAGGLGDPLTVEYKGRNLHLDTEVPACIRDLLAAISLEAGSVPTGLKRGAEIDASLGVRAVYRDRDGGASPVAGLPLAVGFAAGSGKFVAPSRTGADGGAAVRLTRIEDADRVQVIRVQVDLEVLKGAGEAGVSLSGFTAPQVDIELTVGRQRVFVQSRELNLGQPLQVMVIEPALKRLLSARGTEFAKSPDQADVLVQIEAQTRQGNRLQNIHFAFLDLTLSCRRADGVEIFKTALNSVKGSGASFELAGIKAFDKGVGELEKGGLAEFLDQL